MHNNFAEAVICRWACWVIAELVGTAQLFLNQTKIAVGIHRLGIELRTAGFFGNAAHDADAVFVASGQFSVLFFGIANGEDGYVFALRGLDGGHHVVRTGIIFAVAEEQQGTSAVFGTGQLLCDRVVDGIVKRGAQFAFFFGPQFWKIAGTMFASSYAGENLGRIVCEIGRQSNVVAETDQEDTVFGAQDIFEKHLQIMLMLLGKVVLAAAD